LACAAAADQTTAGDAFRYGRNPILVAEKGIDAHGLRIEQICSNPKVGLGFVGRPNPSDAKVICSFPMRFGGAPFIEDLHRRLTSRLQWQSDTEFYVDLLRSLSILGHQGAGVHSRK
jgi:hypothetical protein